jgi:hypothetical protein
VYISNAFGTTTNGRSVAISFMMMTYGGIIDNITYFSSYFNEIACSEWTNQTIDSTDLSTLTNVTCRLGNGGAGPDWYLRVYYRRAVILDPGIVISTDRIIFAAPLFVSGSLRNSSEINTMNGTTLLEVPEPGRSYSIAFSLQMPPLLISLGGVTVLFGPTLKPALYDCSDAIIIPGTTTLACTTDPTAFGVVLFRLYIGTSYSTSTDVVFFRAEPAIVISVSGCAVNTTSDQGFGTSECPTNGASTMLTVVSSSYAGKISVLIGSQECTPLTLLNNGAGPIHCQLPDGAGLRQPVVVVAGDLPGNTYLLVSYAAPTIIGIQGCSTNIIGQQATNCSRFGDDRLTIYGTNFGASGASIFIGALVCRQTIHSEENPHGELYCDMPAGRGIDRPVLVRQNRGQLSRDSTATVNYAYCGSGKTDDLNNFPTRTDPGCIVCSRGTATLIGDTCADCSIGRYAPMNGSGVCEECPPQHIAVTVGQYECQACPVGKFTTVDINSCDACTTGKVVTPTGCDVCRHPALIEESVNCVCAPSYYASSGAETNQPVCERCPRGAVCTDTGVTSTNMLARAGYWRPSSSSSLNTSEVEYILCIRPSHCSGGSLNSQCAPHRYGDLCLLCDNDYYDDALSTGCRECPPRGAIAIEMIIISVLAILLLLFLIWFSLKQTSTSRGSSLFARHHQRDSARRANSSVPKVNQHNKNNSTMGYIPPFTMDDPPPLQRSPSLRSQGGVGVRVVITDTEWRRKVEDRRPDIMYDDDFQTEYSYLFLFPRSHSFWIDHQIGYH